jgi:hypothetical protein
MFWIPYSVSKRKFELSHRFLELTADNISASHPNYHKYEYLLTDGWVPGHKIVGVRVSHRLAAAYDL